MANKKKQINIGLLGAGTVGGGVILVLNQNRDLITERVGCPICIQKVLARHPDKVRALDPKLATTDNIDDIINDPDIDIVVELMGREHPALEYMEAALKAGKNVVTANKDVVATHGKKLFELAAQNHVDFLFEAAVAGGIPIIRPLKESLAANKVTKIMGIINGTTNYMLTKMTQDHMDFAEVLKEAQDKGYAESDPTADVGGFDAARKIAILASIAFNSRVSLDDVDVEGIDKISSRDIEYASELGYVIKLLGIAKQKDGKGISARVHPTMLRKDHPLATVNDVFNAVYVEGQPIGEAMFFGRGAGRMPTASAVCGDIIESTRNIQAGCTGRVGCTCYEHKPMLPPEEIVSPCYIRMLVEDQPGVWATIAKAFGDSKVSLNTVVQKRSLGNLAEIVVITYGVSEFDLRRASEALGKLSCVARICNIIRVEDDQLA
ncbi:homoserine dehydrogenase [Acidaminococcus timonensis]|uniref:homoserine dehydrogenase n=1 Tax=Acidaminococcus timonensis TaxID=1871002 RepID=UPI0029433591|nr:homoserine dehydrogenase [Acidaminococcus timonensis]